MIDVELFLFCFDLSVFLPIESHSIDPWDYSGNFGPRLQKHYSANCECVQCKLFLLPSLTVGGFLQCTLKKLGSCWPRGWSLHAFVPCEVCSMCILWFKAEAVIYRDSPLWTHCSVLGNVINTLQGQATHSTVLYKVH